MHNNILYKLIMAPVLVWLAMAALLMIGYLAWLEITERLRNRRMDKRRVQLSLEQPYRPTTVRRLAFQTTESPIMLSRECLKFRQPFPRNSRPAGWGFTAANLN